MTSTPDVIEEEEPQLCSVNSLKEFCKKNPKLLLVFTNEDRTEFLQKFMDTAVPKDIAVASSKAGGSCEINKELDIGEKPSAILIENGEVKNRIDLQNDDVKDTAGLMKMLSEEKQSEEQDELKEESDSCKVKFEINKKNWKLEPELSEQCERELSKIDDLRPAAKRYIKRHISEE